MSDVSFNLCVFCASSPRVDQHYKDLAQSVGRLCAAQGWRIIYGGGRNGLMGAMADGALAQGGEVVGIIPRLLQDKETGHDGLTALHVVETMHERQMQMAERADGFLVLPGGMGTMAEFFEIVTWWQLGLHKKPIALLNEGEYWSDLIAMIEKMTQENFLYSMYEDVFSVLKTLDEVAVFFNRQNKSGDMVESDLI